MITRTPLRRYLAALPCTRAIPNREVFYVKLPSGSIRPAAN